MNEQIIVYAFNEILFHIEILFHKKEWSTDTRYNKDISIDL